MFFKKKTEVKLNSDEYLELKKLILGLEIEVDALTVRKKRKIPVKDEEEEKDKYKNAQILPM